MPTPFIGIGAMRAGTSWLSQLLASHPDCGMHPSKEMHFFDVRYDIVGKDFLRYQAKLLERNVHKAGLRLNAGMDRLLSQDSKHSISSEQEDEDEDKNENENENDFGVDGPLDASVEHDPHKSVISDRARSLYKQIAAFAERMTLVDPQSYKEVLLRVANGRSAFGEFTPGYALLPAAAFREMIGLFPDAKFIFVMRDPIDRLWSQVRYRNTKAKKSGRTARDLDSTFLKALSNSQFVERSNYHKTIQTLESEVPVDRILYVFYEKMVGAETGPSEIRRIESELGLKALELSPDLFEKPRNASQKSEISEENVAAALECFAPVYGYVSERFGLPARWRTSGGVEAGQAILQRNTA